MDRIAEQVTFEASHGGTGSDVSVSSGKQVFGPARAKSFRRPRVPAGGHLADDPVPPEFSVWSIPGDRWRSDQVPGGVLYGVL